jgi:crossover junction endodeoxyribonuclease RusA
MKPDIIDTKRVILPLQGDRLQRLELTLPWPPTVNHYWIQWVGRNRGSEKLRVFMAVSKSGEKYRKAVADAVKGIGHVEGRLSMSLIVFPPDRLKRDLDNILKPLLDALAHAGAYRDDSQVDELRVLRARLSESKEGEVFLTIEEIPSPQGELFT